MPEGSFQAASQRRAGKQVSDVQMTAVREATPEDAAEMSSILREILMSWGSKRPSSAAHVIANYIDHPDRIRCSVATDAQGRILGFQSLKIASGTNPYDLPAGWGIIGTYVAGCAAGKGVGRALFSASLAAAKAAEITEIDATIGDGNDAGLAYYDALGFETYKTKPGAICKKLRVRQNPPACGGSRGHMY